MRNKIQSGDRQTPLFNVARLLRAVALKAFYIRNSDGNRYALYLYRGDDGQWNWNYNWLDNHWNANNPSVALATFFISLPFSYVWESFLLVIFLSNHQTFCRLHSIFQTTQYIFCYPKT